MWPLNSLRNRVTATLLTFAAFVALAVGFLGYIVNEKFEEAIWRSTLEAELAYYLAYIKQNPAAPLIKAGSLTGYMRGPHILPERQPPAVFSQLEPGLHDELSWGGRQFAVLVRDVGQSRAYMTFDITDLEAQERLLSMLVTALIAIVTLLLGVLSYWLGGRLSEPVQDLARRVSGFDPAARGECVGRRYADIEVATIAEAIDRYMARLDEFVAREQEFTGTTSHELRTPVAAIKGATEVLKAIPDLPAQAQSPLARVDQAAVDMEEIISALLYLAREPDGSPLPRTAYRADELLYKVLDNHQYLTADKDLHVGVIQVEPTVVTAPEQVIITVLSNVIRNAFEHTEQGRVVISLLSGVLTVTNNNVSAASVAPAEVARRYEERVRHHGLGARRRGLGIIIIKRLSERVGWTMAWVQDDHQTTVTLDMTATLNP